MTEDEWLNGLVAAYAPEEQIGRLARSIQRQLAEPRMPEESTPQMQQVMSDAPAAREPAPPAQALATSLEWLERTGAFAHWHPWSEDSEPYRAAIRAALTKMMASQGTSDPILPAHATPGLLKAMADAFRKSEEDKLEDDMRLVHAAAHAHLSFKPGKTKTVYVVAAHWDGFKPSRWRDCSTADEAGRFAAAFAKDGGLVTITPEQRPA